MVVLYLLSLCKTVISSLTFGRIQQWSHKNLGLIANVSVFWFLFIPLITYSFLLSLFKIINVEYSYFIMLCLFLLHSKVNQLYIHVCCCCCSVTKSCPALCNSMDGSMPGLPIPHITCSLPKFMSIESEMLSNHLILCHPLLLLPSIFPSI